MPVDACVVRQEGRRGHRVERVRRQVFAVHEWAEQCSGGRIETHPNGIHRAQQAIRRNLLDFIDAVARNAQFLDQGLGHHIGVFPRIRAQKRPALDRRAVVEPLPAGHRQKRAGLQSTAGLAKNHHIPGIASKPGDVLMHPVQTRNQVQHTDQPGCRVLLAAYIREVAKTEDVNAMVDGHHHHVAPARERLSIDRRLSAASARPGSAVAPEHHGPFAA